MEFDKEEKIGLSEHFSTEDFACHCEYKSCKTNIIDDELVLALEELWEIIGEIKINSGFRCKRHNKDVGGESNSQHLFGKAVDIESPKNIIGAELAKYALQIEAFEKGGLGVASSWIHVDVRKNGRARWTYPILDS